MTVNPAKLTKENINKVHDAVYHQPLHSGLVYSEAGLVYIRKTFPDTNKFVRLLVVPELLQNIVFVAFHTNPIAAHLSAFRTYARMRL